MTPKKKAIELFTKYSDYFTIWDTESDLPRLDKYGTEYTKLSAILCVDEIINDNPNIYDSDRLNYKYWQEVKKELELI